MDPTEDPGSVQERSKGVIQGLEKGRLGSESARMQPRALEQLEIGQRLICCLDQVTVPGAAKSSNSSKCECKNGNGSGCLDPWLGACLEAVSDGCLPRAAFVSVFAWTNNAPTAKNNRGILQQGCCAEQAELLGSFNPDGPGQLRSERGSRCCRPAQ